MGTAAANASLAVVRVSGREYPVVSEPRCLTCQSTYRDEVERAVARSYSFEMIARSLPTDAGLSARNLSDHFRKGHLPVDNVAVTQLRERDAQERGEVVAEAAAAVVDAIGFARRVIGRVDERVLAGELAPDVRDGLAAAALVAKYEADEPEGYDHDSVFEGFMVYMKSMRNHCTPEQMRAIAADISQNPVMKQLHGRVSAS